MHPDLRLRSATPLADPTPEQIERMRAIFEMLIGLFEHAYRISCRCEVFRLALPLLLRGKDPDFVVYIRRVADEEAPGAF